MEAWFSHRVLGLSLFALLLAAPGPLGAGTPGNNGTEPVTAGARHSTGEDELGSAGSGATSTSSSSESLSPSQRNLLLSRAAAETHGAARSGQSGFFHDTEQTQAFTETSSRSLETTGLSTEPLASTLVVATTEASSSIASSSSTRSSSITSGSSSSTSGSSITSGSSSSTSGSITSGSSSITSSSSTSSITSGSSSITSGSITSGSNSITSGSITSGSITNGSSSITSSSSNSSITSGSITSGSRDWRDLTSTEHMLTSSREEQDTRLPQNSPSTTLLFEDATPLSSQTAVLTDHTYTSTTISRAGERTLLSVTSSSSNITSSGFTEHSSSQQPSSTWDGPSGATETEHYTHSAPSTGTDSRDTTNQQMTQSTQDTQETGSPGGSQTTHRATHSLSSLPNATQHQPSSTAQEPSGSTPPLRATAPSTEQSVAPASHTPPITSPTGGATNASESDHNLRSTEPTTASHSTSTQNQDGTERFSSQTSEESVSVGSSTVSPSVSGSTSEMSSSTETPAYTYLTTAPVNVTDRSQMTENTASTTATTATPPLPAASSSTFSSTSRPAPESPTEATVPDTTAPTPTPTLALQTSTASTTPSVPPSRTQGPPTASDSPTDATTLQTETGPGTVEVTTAPGLYISTTYTRSPPATTTEAVHTTGKQTDRATTELLTTTSPSDIQTTGVPPLTTNPCASNPCVNGGLCLYNYTTSQFSCKCQQAWTGPTCNQDVDECEQEPCPAGSLCVNTRGSFSCECPLGFDLEDGRTCTRAKTFLGTFRVSRDAANTHEIQRELIQLLNASLSSLRGYRRSTLSKKENNGLHILAVNMFSISANVTSAEVHSSILVSLSNCSSSLAHCRKVLNSVALPVYLHNLTYHEESLCAAQETQCDKDRSSCVDNSGTAHCQCHEGYYKHNPDDLSCLECGDGYKLENGTCIPCIFGFGGFNCGNFYKLIAVVVAPTGGGLLLILIIALTVTCCKKNKNDINKIIFKSGDLQMSPYADFPKNNRISMEWGRETIEMQENGSTKNLLQMTDIYYSPALRNSDLDRNGLYPFMGLPGSRHSCIYPAQWNPSFISDDSRRRDYF